MAYTHRLPWIYKVGVFLILFLPLVTVPPWFYPPDWGKTILFKIIFSVLLFTFLWQFLFRRNELQLPKLKRNVIFWLLVGLGGAYLLASIFGADPYFSFFGSPLRAGGVVNFLLYLFFALFCFILFKEEKEWEQFWLFSMGIAILVSLLALIEYYALFTNIFVSVDDRPPSTIGNPIFLGMYLLLIIFITVGFFLKEKRWLWKLGYGLAVLLFAYVILITGSRGAYIGFLVAVIYAILCFPKKIPLSKIATIALLVLVGIAVYYTNSRTQFPPFLEKNRLFQSVRPRLSLKNSLEDTRFPSWEISFKSFLDRPLLGWGPENLGVGFNRHFNTSAPGWWDRSHNIVLQTANDAGILGLVAYLGLFGFLLWEMHKVKKQGLLSHNEGLVIMAHMVQTTLIAYFVSNLFGIDSFPTYLLFVLLVGFSMYLIERIIPQTSEEQVSFRVIKGRGFIIGVALLVLIIFIWQYSVVPAAVNTNISIAQNLHNDQCNTIFTLMDNALVNSTFVDAYAESKYVEFLRDCSSTNQADTAAYLNKGLELLQKAIAIHPSEPRLWLFYGAFKTVGAVNTNDPAQKQTYIQGALDALYKAMNMAPNREEIILELAKAQMIAQDYKGASTSAKECLAVSDDADCHWLLYLSDIYNKDSQAQDRDLKIIIAKGKDINSPKSLNDLGTAYSQIEDYPNLVAVYQKLIKIYPGAAEYHSSLAFTYSKLGQYANARAEAMVFLKLMPQAKDEVQAFLQTLPPQYR